jgi:hypothetical protein
VRQGLLLAGLALWAAASSARAQGQPITSPEEFHSATLEQLLAGFGLEPVPTSTELGRLLRDEMKRLNTQAGLDTKLWLSLTVTGGGSGAPEAAAQSMMSVIQTVLAAQLVAKGDLAGLGESGGPARRDGSEAPGSPANLPAPPGPSPTGRASRGG